MSARCWLIWSPTTLTDMQHRRFVLHDDTGPIRRVATRDEAEALLATRPDWRLIVEPRKPRPVIDLAAIPDAPF